LIPISGEHYQFKSKINPPQILPLNNDDLPARLSLTIPVVVDVGDSEILNYKAEKTEIDETIGFDLHQIDGSFLILIWIPRNWLTSFLIGSND